MEQEINETNLGEGGYSLVRYILKQYFLLFTMQLPAVSAFGKYLPLLTSILANNNYYYSLKLANKIK